MLRSVEAVFAGFLVTGLLCALFIALASGDTGAWTESFFEGASFGVFGFAGFLGGYATAILAPRKLRLHSGIVGFIYIVIVVSYPIPDFARTATLFVPAAIYLGGVVCVRQALNSFQTFDQTLEAVHKLAERLEKNGHESSAAELRHGVTCLESPTNGLMRFIESLERVQAQSWRFPWNEILALLEIRTAIVVRTYEDVPDE